MEMELQKGKTYFVEPDFQIL
ncbi:hypothetical protein Avbf_15503 [Armadillidium vulgare]|nr:hypothetical protein Avbf_15503 [Armadillidium vulgare]